MRSFLYGTTSLHSSFPTPSRTSPLRAAPISGSTPPWMSRAAPRRPDPRPSFRCLSTTCSSTNRRLPPSEPRVPPLAHHGREAGITYSARMSADNRHLAGQRPIKNASDSYSAWRGTGLPRGSSLACFGVGMHDCEMGWEPDHACRRCISWGITSRILRCDLSDKESSLRTDRGCAPGLADAAELGAGRRAWTREGNGRGARHYPASGASEGVL